MDDTDLHHGLNLLARGWRLRELGASACDRVPVWDLVILTAAHEVQAQLYRQCLDRLRAAGGLPARTAAMVVPDPDGRRIGSGGATLHALRVAAEAHGDLAGTRVLLVHSGGDSRRVPWANLFGKAFLPLPLLADSDHAVPTLFDHLLAITAPLPRRLSDGGLAIFTGDVLPLFDCGGVELADGATVITKPVSLDVAGRHGVICAPDHPAGGPVTGLLQKPTPAAIADAGALVGGASALLDTGIFCFAGRGWRALAGAAAELGVAACTHVGSAAVSLYEDIAGAMVAACHERVRATAMGPALLAHLGAVPLHHGASPELAFLHFGTQAEIVDHFAGAWQGRLGRRLHARCGPDAARDAVILESRLDERVAVGGASLVLGCELGSGWAVGRRSVVVGVRDPGSGVSVGDHQALWHVPVRDASGPGACAVLVAGIFDDPKRPDTAAVFMNRPLRRWLDERHIGTEDIWDGDRPRDLWHARLFPVSGDAGMRATLARMLLGAAPDAAAVAAWRAAPRVAYADLSAVADATAVEVGRRAHLQPQVCDDLTRALAGGLDRDVSALVAQCGPSAVAADDASVWPSESRWRQVRADLLRAGDWAPAGDAEAERAFLAVRCDVAAAVPAVMERAVRDLQPGTVVDDALPVRFDIAGGWTDTPPVCLERVGHVCNLAVHLAGAPSVGAVVEVLCEPRIELELGDDGERRTVTAIPDAIDLHDAFLLPLTALRLCGFGSPTGVSQGVRVRTWSRAPRGSGLGASSILGASLIRALQRVAGRDDDVATVANLVLVLEQRMTTGGGWQDQLGGLVPGVKLCSSLPTRPLELRVEPVPLLPAASEELQRRLVLFFTGQQRLARNVLEIVVGRYLRREASTLRALDDLAGLALAARGALSRADFDGLGGVMAEAWQVHQQLDANCSNPVVDGIFAAVEDLTCGAKLAGAGGGGCAAAMAKDTESAQRLRSVLSSMPDVRVYEWSL